MKIGILFLVLGYFLSQFYRSFLAVLSPVLEMDIGATSGDLSFASGLWFIVFAAMQIPVGWALDRFGPRLTTVVLLAIGGGGGALVFASASSPSGIMAAMALFGVGGAPILMASYYIFARLYAQALFSTLAGAMIGFGSAGNLASAAPLAYVVQIYGWRTSMVGLAIAAFVIAAALWMFLKDPEKPATPADKTGSLLGLLTNKNLLLIFPLMLVNYAPAAGLRGLWAGPYFNDVFSLGPIDIGRATLVMALAMMAGSFFYGPAERYFGSKKRVILVANLGGAGFCLILWAYPDSTWVTSGALFTVIGFCGATFPVLMAHGQQFIPAHLTGRGITLLNLFGIGGVGLMQFITSAMARYAGPESNSQPDFYGQLFLLFGIGLVIGCVIYSFSRERP